MEIIVVLIVFGLIGFWIYHNNRENTAKGDAFRASLAPYKVETPTDNWPFPRASEIAPAPAPVVATAPAKKPRAPARPKAATAEKPVLLKKPRAKKTPAK